METLLHTTHINPNLLWVVTGTAGLAAISALIGTFTYLQKKSLLSDAVAHGMLPGIAGAFLLYGQKDPFILMLGALTWGFISVFSIDWISRNTLLRPTGAMAVVLSVYFGLGMMLLTRVQQSGLPDATGLQGFLFGQAASIVPYDLLIFSSFGVLALIVLIANYRHLKWVSFDPEGAKSRGVRVDRYHHILSILVVTGTAIGLQSIGLILMASLLITPAALARMWTNKLSNMLLLAAAFGAGSAIVGASISFIDAKMPTGPWIVLCLAGTLLVSAFFSPQKGWWKSYVQRKQNTAQIHRENLLKTMFHLKETGLNTVGESDILRKRHFVKLPKLLQELQKLQCIEKQDQGWIFTEIGLQEGRRLTRLHRLWELYLTRKLRLQTDHIHPLAESIEHIITPELEVALLKELGNPEVDPHMSIIPYDKPQAHD